MNDKYIKDMNDKFWKELLDKIKSDPPPPPPPPPHDKPPNDHNDCSIFLFENLNPQTRPEYYGWTEYSVGILDQRRFALRLDKDYNDD